ncbi:hypothetical protein MACK_001677 [Theileria orientalis]|uniref:RAP domain-containing protein n=1 Tax=Theileria orientalis TaxID=68886 RepID=A0A976QTM8_THEOR|nr:hypothetical protein MACK_001677 [Theileria orientalis]
MFARKIRLNFTFFGRENIKPFLRFHNHSDVDSNLFFSKLLDEHSSLTPFESVLASNYLNKIFYDPSKCSFSPSDVLDLKKQLINNIRSKLYSLSDLKELCNITIYICKSGILTKNYVSDFLSRLDKLIVSINFECVPVICESLALLHANGYKVCNVCIKFYNVLTSDNIVEKLDNLSLVKLVEFSTNLNINNVNLDKKIVSVIKDRLRSDSIPPDAIISLIEANHFKRSRLHFINPSLLFAILKDNKIGLETVVKCLNSCKDLKGDFDKLDKLFLSNKDKLILESKLDLLDNFARFRYKPSYLNDFLEEICKDVLHLNFEQVLRLFKNTYELNINNRLVVERFKECINENQSPFLILTIYISLHTLNIISVVGLEYNELYSDVLLAMCHFFIDDFKLYNSLLYEVIRNEYKLKDADKIKLQIFYTMLRCDYMDNRLIDFIDSDVKNYLDSLTDYYEVTSGSDHAYVSSLILSLSHTIYEKVKIGGFYVDFIRPPRRTPGPFIPSEHGVALLIEECYKTNSDHSHTSASDSTAPKSLSNTREECSSYLLIKNVLNRLNVKYLCVSMCALWALNRKQRLEYIKMLISKHTD